MKVTLTIDKKRLKRILFDIYKAGVVDGHEGEDRPYDETPTSSLQHVKDEVIRLGGTWVETEP